MLWLLLLPFLPLLEASPSARPCPVEHADEYTAYHQNDARRPSAFVHPGVLVSQPQLDFIKDQIVSSEEPWTGALSGMKTYAMAKLGWKPHPVPTVRCSDGNQPDIGCEDERMDALAAYSAALVWAVEGNTEYARQAILIMDAWSATVARHTGANAPLQSGWAAATWARAAEIIRHTGAGWSDDGIKAFERMLSRVYMPFVHDGSRENENNWDLVMLEAAQSIAIFLDDSAAYDHVMERFKTRVPAYIYLSTDGDIPKSADGSKYKSRESIVRFWQGVDFFFDGRSQEICRDLEHAGYGISSISHMMETARIQGEDLYNSEMGLRLERALEVHSRYANGGSAPRWLCSGKLKYKLLAVTEVGFNALANRLGRTMPFTKAYTLSKRPATSNWLFAAWETLTHAGNPA